MPVIYTLLASAMTMQSQPPVPSAEQIETYNTQIERLDAELKEKDYEAIGKEVQSLNNCVSASATLDWLGTQFQRGESVYIAWQYSRLLDAFGQNPATESLRATALAAMLYVVAASSVEALQCADRTAWSDRSQTFAQMLAQSGLLTLSEGQRKQAAWVAQKVERANWERRKVRDDAEFLCMNGMAAMTAGIAEGTVREAEPQPGQFGRQMRVEVPEGFVYERRENEVWWAAAEQMRETLPSMIARLANIERIPTDAEMRSLSGS